MILGFGDPATEDLFHGHKSARIRRFPPEVLAAAPRKLDMLNAAVTLGDLMVPPGNRLEKLKGDLAAYHSIRVNQQWRIIFVWSEQGASDVQIVDYH